MTWLVNLFFAHVLESAVPYATAAVFVGLLGGFTTSSSLALDTLTLGQGGHTTTAFWNVAAQILLGLAAAFGGYFIGVGHLA
jgi:fluoride exporter